MRLLPGLLVVPLLSLSMAGCSHGTVSAIPTAPAPTITTLTITPVGGGTMLQGLSAPITSSGPMPASGALGAFARYSDGSGEYVQATWRSSDDSIVSIDGSTLNARGRGTATVTATAQGKTASETFIVEPGIAGTWSGNYVVEQCGAGSAAMYELICLPPTPGRTTGVLAVGAKPPLTMQITQSGKDLTAVAQFGELRGTLSGTDRGSNFLTFGGDLRVNATTVTFVYWDGRVRTDLMEGFIAFEVRINGVPSLAQVTAHFENLTRR